MTDELVLLNMAKGVGSIKTRALLDYFKTSKAVFGANAAELMNVAGIGKKIAEDILRVSKDRSLIEKEKELIKKHNVKLVTIFDEDYPLNLKQIYDPPIVLYIKGRIEEQDKLAVAIVGSRKCSNYGRDTAERLSTELSDFGVTIISGMARGIDTAAHNGAIKNNARTIAVLGSGLAEIYPPENRKLADRIADCGAVVSEFPMAMPPVPENFPRRNRIISGLSLGVVVVEAAKDSGALITAKFAAEQGREVFSVPGQAGLVNSFGTNRLIRDGAKLVETAKDILEELMPAVKNCIAASDEKTVAQKEILPADLKSEELKILKVLEEGPMYIDKIAEESLMAINIASSNLINLEIRGLIKRLPGNVFSRKG